MKYLMNVRTPWGQAGQVVDIAVLNDNQRWQLESGAMTLVDDTPPVPVEPEVLLLDEDADFIDEEALDGEDED